MWSISLISLSRLCGFQLNEYNVYSWLIQRRAFCTSVLSYYSHECVCMTLCVYVCPYNWQYYFLWYMAPDMEKQSTHNHWHFDGVHKPIVLTIKIDNHLHSASEEHAGKRPLSTRNIDFQSLASQHIISLTLPSPRPPPPIIPKSTWGVSTWGAGTSSSPSSPVVCFSNVSGHQCQVAI